MTQKVQTYESIGKFVTFHHTFVEHAMHLSMESTLKVMNSLKDTIAHSSPTLQMSSNAIKAHLFVLSIEIYIITLFIGDLFHPYPR